MHSVILPRNDSTFNERRRHVRHNLKTSTTVVVQLGPNNGGNLLDIGGGGLSLQAVAKLIPEMELTLSFRLEGIQESIKTVGRITWVGPTQKVAGISFKNLPDSTEQQIVEWIANQERSAQENPSIESADYAQPRLTVSPPEITETKPAAVAPPLPQPPASVSGISSQKKIVLPLHRSLESIAAHSKPALETITLSKTAAALSTRQSVSLDLSLISPDEANLSDSSKRELLRESFASDSRRRHWKFAITIVAVVMGILGLFAMNSNLGRFFGHGVEGTPPPDAVNHEAAPQGSRWVNRLKAFLGISAPAKMDPAKAGVQVWTHDGFYYCADDPNFLKVEPGAIMTQAEALQNKFTPRLGFCQ